jgi:hypothetical protein
MIQLITAESRWLLFLLVAGWLVWLAFLATTVRFVCDVEYIVRIMMMLIWWLADYCK